MVKGVGFAVVVVVMVVVMVKSKRRIAQLLVPPAQFDIIITFSNMEYICPEPILILATSITKPLPIRSNPLQSLPDPVWIIRSELR